MMQVPGRGVGPDVGLQIAVEFTRKPNGQFAPCFAQPMQPRGSRSPQSGSRQFPTM
jgi:hypothetical protein